MAKPETRFTDESLKRALPGLFGYEWSEVCQIEPPTAEVLADPAGGERRAMVTRALVSDWNGACTRVYRVRFDGADEDVFLRAPGEYREPTSGGRPQRAKVRRRGARS